MKPEVVAVQCPKCESKTIHIICEASQCKHDAGLEMMRHIGREHPELVYTAEAIMNEMERYRLAQVVRLSRN